MNTLTFQEFIESIIGSKSFWAVIFVVFITLIEITPIKINPLSWIAKHIGQAINKELLDKVDAMDQKIVSLEEKSDERDATLCRTRFLRFGDEVMHGIPHSKEHYDQTLADIDTYETFCSSHPNYLNNVAKVTIRHIKNKYEEHLKEDSFL